MFRIIDSIDYKDTPKIRRRNIGPCRPVGMVPEVTVPEVTVTSATNGNNSPDAIVYLHVFEQSILINHGSNKPWSFVASVGAELVAVSLIILIPLAYTDHLPEFHWKSVTVAPSVQPIQPAIVPHQASGSFTQAIFSRPIRIWNPFAPKNDVTAASTVQSTIDLPSDLPATGAQYSASILPSDLVGKPVAVQPYKPPAVIRPNQPSSPIRVSEGVQMAKLINRVMPLYPPLAKSARISGVVHLIGIISKDGTIRNLQVVSGHPLLTKAALDAVSQWVYKPTLLNNEAVEVIAPIDVNFTLSP
jgi:protein TonB